MSARHASRSIIDAFPVSQPSSYICRQCRQSIRSAPQIVQQRRYASNQPNEQQGQTLPERLRAKLWKGKAPGPENIDDVYGGPGVFETMRKERRQRKQLKEQVQAAVGTLGTQVEAPYGRRSAVADLQAASSEQQTSSRDSQQQSELMPQEEVDIFPRRIEALPSTNAAINSWDGLDIIGHQGEWHEMPAKPEDQYQPWMNHASIKSVWTYEDLVSLMHRAIVECAACKDRGIDPTKNFVIGINQSDYGQVLSHATINLDEKKAISGIQYSKDFVDEVLSKDERHELSSAPNLSQMYTPMSETFLEARLDPADPMVFAILARFALLTGHRVPDPLLTNLPSQELGEFLRSFAQFTKPKPKHLAEILLKDDMLAEQKNLLILGRRETPVDKEKELGRWKIIEAELKARGLPVLGRVQVQR